jgi:peptide/nickel transport system substrate-binding protein
MKRLIRWLSLPLATVMVASLFIVPVLAQDSGEGGQGGIIIDSTFGGDPTSLNPILCQDTTCADLAGLMYPALVSVDPETAQFRKSGPAAIAKDWTISPDGKVYTFTLRDDYKWNDGTPVTGQDFVYSYQAIASGKLSPNPAGFILDSITNVESPDPQTVVITFKQADCRALNFAGSVFPLPSHKLTTDFEALNTDAYNLGPDVTAGPFKFSEFRPGEQVSVVADQNFKDAELGYVSPEGYILKQVPDATVMVEQFLAGETNFIDAPTVSRRSDVRQAGTEGKKQVYAYPGNFWDYLAFNLADPKNPQNGLDANGNPIDQGHHPIFGDKRVRQAIARAVDIDAMIKAAVFGEGERMTSGIIPASWAYNKDLAPIPYDVEAAKKLLDEAGWIDDDNNPDTPRIAKGAMYAKDGTPLRFTMLGNEGNTRRAAEGQLIQDQLKRVGIDAQYQAIDFTTFQEIQNSQTFDVVMLAWQQGYPDDPDQTQLFTPVADVVGSGNDFTSYNNPEFTKLNEQARTLPGCDPAERKKLYDQMQVILQEDVPYLWMYAINGMYSADASVKGFGPYPSNKWWNIDTWNIQTPK